MPGIGGGEVGDLGGRLAGAGEGVDPSPYRTVAVVAAGRWQAARARIQAAEATGPVKGSMEPEMSQAMPTLSGGAGTRRLRVRVKGSAVGTAPAARWARAATARLMRSRPGGSWEVAVVVARCRRWRRAARGRGGGRRRPRRRGGRGCPWRRRAGPRCRRPSRAALLGAAAGGVLGGALGGLAGREGGGGGAKSAATVGGDLPDGLGDGLGELGGDLDDDRGGRRGVGVDAEDAAPAAGEAWPGSRASSSAVFRNSRQVARRRSSVLGAGDGLDLGRRPGRSRRGRGSRRRSGRAAGRRRRRPRGGSRVRRRRR